MASINKLAIHGIHSFSPDDEEEVIKFSFPLTVSFGSNGCGKTSKCDFSKPYRYISMTFNSHENEMDSL
jgi:hypothetical protein